MRYDMFQELLEKIEDLEDSLDAVLRKDEPAWDFDEVMAELESEDIVLHVLRPDCGPVGGV